PEDGFDNPQSWPVCACLTPHLLTLGSNPDDASVISDWPSLLNRASGYFYGRGAYVQAEPLLRDALAIREKALGPEHPNTAASLNTLAHRRRRQGDFGGARPLYERALAIYEKVGPEHPYTATSLNNLAGLLLDQRDLAAARPLYERALAIHEKALGPEHPDMGTSLNDLGRLLYNQGDLAGARQLCERALAIYEKALGPEHP